MKSLSLIYNKKFNYSKLSRLEYEKNGFFLISDLINKKICQNIKKYAEKNFAEKPNYPITLNIHRKDKIFLNIIQNKKFANIIRFFQKTKKIDALNDQMIYKKKNSIYGGQSWTYHQDNAYPKAKYGAYVILHFFLDDSTPKNGGLIFFKGSHKEKILPYSLRVSHKEKKNKKGITRPGRTINNTDMKRIKKTYEKVDLDAKSGSVCIMHSHLVHGSYPNVSKTKDRATYSMAYLNRGVKIKEVGKSSKKIRTQIY